MAFLPDPEWTKSLPHCLSCGYSLAGILPPAPCPECGAVFGERYLVVHGVPKTVATTGSRRVEILVAVVGLALLSQFWVFVLFRFGFWLTLAVAFGAIAFAFFIVRRGNRSEGGKCRFLFSEAGVARQSLEADNVQGYAFVRWRGGEAVGLRRISSVWYELVIASANHAPTLQAGIRCTDKDAKVLKEDLEAIIGPLPQLDESNAV